MDQCAVAGIVAAETPTASGDGEQPDTTAPKQLVGIQWNAGRSMASKVMAAGMDETYPSDPRAQFLNICSLIRDVSQTLGNIDFEHDAAMRNLEFSRSSDDQKRFIRGKLVAQHRERCEPYVMLLNAFRRQLQSLPHAA